MKLLIVQGSYLRSKGMMRAIGRTSFSSGTAYPTNFARELALSTNKARKVEVQDMRNG